MSRRLAVAAAPGALEAFAENFDNLFERRNQRDSFRRYLEGLLLPSERNKTLTGLANTEPLVGAQKPVAQKLQWFLSESSWDPDMVNERRLQLVMTHPELQPDDQGALVIDETGDRKWGHKTAFVGKQYLGSVGKVDNGVVSVHALWADERVYHPLVFEPFIPARWFGAGKDDPKYRTKQQLALELVSQARVKGIPFRAVVADSLYGEHRAFKQKLNEQGIAFVVTLKPSHDWYHYRGDIGCVRDIAEAAPWQRDAPGDWQEVNRQVVMGAGLGLFFVPAAIIALSGVAARDVGVASATLNTVQQIGGALGPALLNTLYVSAVGGYLAASRAWSGRCRGRSARGCPLRLPNRFHRRGQLVRFGVGRGRFAGQVGRSLRRDTESEHRLKFGSKEEYRGTICKNLVCGGSSSSIETKFSRGRCVCTLAAFG